MNNLEGFELLGIAIDKEVVSSATTPRRKSTEHQQGKKKSSNQKKKTLSNKKKNSLTLLNIQSTKIETPRRINSDASTKNESHHQSRWKQLYGKKESSSSPSPLTTTISLSSSKSDEMLLHESNNSLLPDWCFRSTTTSSNQIERDHSISDNSSTEANKSKNDSSVSLDYSILAIKSFKKNNSYYGDDDNSKSNCETIHKTPELIEDEDGNNHYEHFLNKFQNNFSDLNQASSRRIDNATCDIVDNHRITKEYQVEPNKMKLLKQKKCLLDYRNKSLQINNISKIKKTPQDPIHHSKICNNIKNKRHYEQMMIKSKLISIGKKYAQKLQCKVIRSWKIYAQSKNQFYLKIQNSIKIKVMKKYFYVWKRRLMDVALWKAKIIHSRDIKIKSMICIHWKIEVVIEKMIYNRSEKILISCILEWHLVSRLAHDEKILEENRKNREDKANEMLVDVLANEKMRHSETTSPDNHYEKNKGVKKVQPKSSIRTQRNTYVCNIKNKPMTERVTAVSRLPLTEQRSAYQQGKRINKWNSNSPREGYRSDTNIINSDQKENKLPERTKIKQIQKNRLILREMQREKWKLAEMHYRIFSLRVSFITWTKILATLNIKNNKAQLYHNDLLKQSSIYNWKLFVKDMQNKRELMHDQNLKNAANYYNLHLMWKSLMLWWEFLTHRRKLKEGVRLYYLQYLTRKSLRKWSRAYAVEGVRLWNLERKGSILAKRIRLRWVFNRWFNAVLDTKREKTLEEKVSLKWVQVRKWLDASE